MAIELRTFDSAFINGQKINITFENSTSTIDA